MDLFGGMNYNLFYDHGSEGGHYQSSYDGDLGYSVGLGIDKIKGMSSFRFMLRLDHYGGMLKASDGALGAGVVTEASVQKSILSLGIYPLSFTAGQHFDINLGMIVSGFLQESIQGTQTNWTFGQPDKVYDLADTYDQYSSTNLYFGIEGRLAYPISLSERASLVPQYMFYYGLNNEFKEFPEKVKSFRNYLCMGISWKMNP